MNLTFISLDEADTRLSIEFELPELQSEVQGELPSFSLPGIYPMSLSTFLCVWDRENTRTCNTDFSESDGTITIATLVNSESAEPNTNIDIALIGDHWNFPAIKLRGQSCPWIWNPC